MRSLDEISKEYADELDGLDDWVQSTYDSVFSKYFINQRSLHEKMLDVDKPITDSELESIMVDIPLQLFSVSEVLNNFRLKCEAIKLHIKDKEYNIVKDKSIDSSETKRKEYAAHTVLEDKFLLSAYESVIARVEKEMSYSRELVMSAKKIWDGRKVNNNPIGEVNPEEDCEELPEYKPVRISKAYIN